MEKKKIETFIKKYHLGGQIESAVWQNKDDDLTVSAMTSDKKLFTSVQLKDGAKGFISGVDVGVLTTEDLKKMLIPLNENISLSLDIDEKDSKRVRQIIGTDGDMEVFYPSQDLTTMDAPPKMKNIPPFEVEITLTPEWITKYNQSFAAIQDDDTLFTLIMSKKKNKLEMILGYKQNLSKKMVLPVNATVGKDSVKNPISFNAKKFKEILSANSDVQNPILRVSEAGLANISFDTDDIKSQYYLVKIDIED